MRNLNVNDGVTNNTRVRILKITTKYISCQTIGDHPIPIVLPRIRFNFRLPYGQSFMMTRLQFPLRRAFALSVHKSQGQTLERGLIDARGGFLRMATCTWECQESPDMIRLPFLSIGVNYTLTYAHLRVNSFLFTLSHFCKISSTPRRLVKFKPSQMPTMPSAFKPMPPLEGSPEERRQLFA